MSRLLCYNKSMKKKTVTEQGRKYEVYADEDKSIPIGPPEHVVDALKLPEPFATRLHNILHQRGLFTYADVARQPQSLQGALQEALSIDVQVLTEAYWKYEQEA